MANSLRTVFGTVLSFVLLFASTLPAQRPANANGAYQQLRNSLPGGEVISVSNFQLHKDAAVFTFKSGSIAFFGEVSGKVTGAVFLGDGHLHIDPPTAEERHALSLYNHTGVFDEDFTQMVMRFTDSSAAELHKAATGKGQDDKSFGSAAIEARRFLRDHSAGSSTGGGETYYYRNIDGNLELRLLEDVVSPEPGGFFWAAIKGKSNPHLYFVLDPHGVVSLKPEEVALMSWNGNQETITYPLSFHRASEYADGTARGTEANENFDLTHEDLDISIEKNGALSVVAVVDARASQDGVAVLPLDLYPSLRVSKVETGTGEPLDWVQESKTEDADFGAILSKPLRKGEIATVKIYYSGKEVIFGEGNGNYYTTARGNWFPSLNRELGSYATYQMRFHVPKGLQIVATGTKVSEKTEGGSTTSEWKTEVPLPVVGFSFGDFAMQEDSFKTSETAAQVIDAYANQDRPDLFAKIANHSTIFGDLSTKPMLAVELSQGKAAAQIYTDLFGALPFGKVSLTQQPACGFGQSWPTLVYIPICGFLDSTQQHFLGIDQTNMYWKTVTPHEVAHQWWGQAVGFASYRDQWMSEGFASASASIFLQKTRAKPDDYREFWREQRRWLVEKNEYGFRPIDVGPVTMGFRLSSPKSSWSVYQKLVYPKGAYILHMLRMMMWSPRDGDARFSAAMKEFAATYRLKAATTEDFKAMMEKHMTPTMDLEGNHKLDWFFRQYVYGTDLPNYHLESQVTSGNGKFDLHLKLTQSNVGDNFKNLVPAYLELTDGHFIRLGQIPIAGSMTKEVNTQIDQGNAGIKRVLINYYYDVLSTEN